MPYKDKNDAYESSRLSIIRLDGKYQKAWEKRTGKDRRYYHLLRKYGITPEAYADMLGHQRGVCLICSEPPSMKNAQTMSLQIDHCHSSGKVRGLLCRRCNVLVGCMESAKDAQILRKAEKYLENHS